VAELGVVAIREVVDEFALRVRLTEALKVAKRIVRSWPTAAGAAAHRSTSVAAAQAAARVNGDTGTPPFETGPGTVAVQGPSV
jgi:mevalonate pyrophosphate decarboxylase